MLISYKQYLKLINKLSRLCTSKAGSPAGLACLWGVRSQAARQEVGIGCLQMLRITGITA